ncbi:MAG: hypothetical protein AB1760_14975, partial [Pseudomonadota bacterium]
MVSLKKAAWRVLITVLAVAIAGASLFWLSQSQVLAIENIEVEGNRAIPTEEVLAMASPLLRGETLLKPSF